MKAPTWSAVDLQREPLPRLQLDLVRVRFKINEPSMPAADISNLVIVQLYNFKINLSINFLTTYFKTPIPCNSRSELDICGKCVTARRRQLAMVDFKKSNL